MYGKIWCSAWRHLRACTLWKASQVSGDVALHNGLLGLHLALPHPFWRPLRISVQYSLVLMKRAAQGGNDQKGRIWDSFFHTWSVAKDWILFRTIWNSFSSWDFCACKFAQLIKVQQRDSLPDQALLRVCKQNCNTYPKMSCPNGKWLTFLRASMKSDKM